MQVLDPDTDFFHVIRQIFCHPLSQRCDQYLVMACHFFVDRTHKIINLAFHRTDRNLRIQKTGRADDLLGTQKLMVCLIRPRRCRYKHHLVNLALKLGKV